MTLMTHAASQLLDKVNAYLKRMPYARPPMGLYDPIAYELSLGGKRVRPVLMLMAYNLYKDDVESILSQAAGLETYHNHTLLHDDVMDQADMRRGKPTVHNVWNENTAILSGDAMLILAYRLMADCPKDKLAEVLSVFTETTMEICEGQQWDMEFETRMDVRVEEYIEMIRLKTSVLLACALKIGAILGGATKEDAEHLYRLGECIGLAFQLRDDYLDVYGDPKVFGKKIGGDILCNKKTYLYINALRLANQEQRAELDRWATATEIDPEEKIAAVTAIYTALGLPEKSRAIEEHYYTLAKAELEALGVSDSQKAVLAQFMAMLMERDV
jgi:geranylgeranyl diphosphate synthase type II